MKRSLIVHLASAIVAAAAADNAIAQDMRRDPPAATAPTANAGDYWTRDRMLSAQPAEMGRPGPPRRRHGEKGRTKKQRRANPDK